MPAPFTLHQRGKSILVTPFFSKKANKHKKIPPQSASSNPLQKRCRECVHLAGKCTIGHGSCYAREKASCTWCGDKCGSICVMSGTKCSDWCGK